MDIYEEALALKRGGRRCALATIVRCEGSSPQREGAKMLVRDDRSTSGTLGGGCLEADVVEAAVSAMEDGSPQSMEFELTEKHGGLVCGGRVLVYVEPLVPRPTLVVLGAGHIGKALSRAAKFCGFRVVVIDDREEFANPGALSGADEVLVRDFTNPFTGGGPARDTYIVVATRGHNHDLDALRAALSTDAAYIGLLGSRRKRALLFKTLREAGYGEEDISRVVTPVGLPIGSVTPEEIAISIMAQIIELRRGNDARGRGGAACGGDVDEDGDSKAAPSARRKAGH